MEPRVALNPTPVLKFAKIAKPPGGDQAKFVTLESRLASAKRTSSSMADRLAKDPMSTGLKSCISYNEKIRQQDYEDNNYKNEANLQTIANNEDIKHSLAETL